ncbi:MAG: hypothetical protein HZB68_04540 [Candidatus Aenigmarchaeota archaeon]|nr:hypothetical protein [Candidatus Aenigmarchaeota archaeon]
METNYEELVDSVFRKLESLDGRDWKGGDSGSENIYIAKLKAKKHDFVAYTQRRIIDNNACSEHRFEYDLVVQASGKNNVIAYTGNKAKDLFDGIKRKIAESELVMLGKENKEVLDDFVDFINS